jgi:hypothetical protein
LSFPKGIPWFVIPEGNLLLSFLLQLPVLEDHSSGGEGNYQSIARRKTQTFFGATKSGLSPTHLFRQSPVRTRPLLNDGTNSLAQDYANRARNSNNRFTPFLFVAHYIVVCARSAEI